MDDTTTRALELTIKLGIKAAVSLLDRNRRTRRPDDSKRGGACIDQARITKAGDEAGDDEARDDEADEVAGESQAGDDETPPQSGSTQ